MITFQYDAQVPSSWQWQGGRAVGAAVVRGRSTSPMSATTASTASAPFQGGANGSVDLNAVDIGAAYLPQNQDPTLGPSSGAWRERVHGEPAARVPRPQQHQRAADASSGTTYHSLQSSFNRRFRNGLAFGANYTLGLSFKGNTGLQKRLQHAADGTISVRADQAAVRGAEREPRDAARTSSRAIAVWDHAGCAGELGAVGRAS